MKYQFLFFLFKFFESSTLKSFVRNSFLQDEDLQFKNYGVFCFRAQLEQLKMFYFEGFCSRVLFVMYSQPNF